MHKSMKRDDSEFNDCDSSPENYYNNNEDKGQLSSKVKRMS